MKPSLSINIIAFLSILVLSCNSKKIEKPETMTKDSSGIITTEEEDTAANSSIIVANETDNNTISVRGYIDVPPENRASVSTFYGGFVKKINVLPGDVVNKGDVLFTLQNPDYLKTQQQYLEAKEQIDYLREAFERQKTLSQENITSTKNFKKAESDYKVMMARYHSLKEQVKLMGLSLTAIEAGQLFSTISIRAPMSGNVIEVNITNGVFADTKDIAVVLLNTDHLHLELDIFEKDALNVKEGQSITFRIPETGTQLYEGEVHLVNRSIDPKKRTVKVHGHINDAAGLNIIAGMFVEAEIELDN